MAKKLTPVKCKYCNLIINRNTEFNYSAVGQRYAHDECIQQAAKSKENREAIHDKIKQLCGGSYVRARVEKQISQNLNDGRTLKGILQTLQYWYDIQKHDPKEAHGGIGIVEYVYEDAQKYFERKRQIGINFGKVPKEEVEKTIERKNALSPPCTLRERIVKPRRKVYFKLD